MRHLLLSILLAAQDNELLCKEDFRKNNSFVVIDSLDTAGENSFLDIIRSTLHIICDANGYEYLNNQV